MQIAAEPTTNVPKRITAIAAGILLTVGVFMAVSGGFSHPSSSASQTTATELATSTELLVSAYSNTNGHTLPPGPQQDLVNAAMASKAPSGLAGSGKVLLIGSSVSKGWNSQDCTVAPEGDNSWKSCAYPKFWGWAQRFGAYVAYTYGVELNQLSWSGSNTAMWLDGISSFMDLKNGYDAAVPGSRLVVIGLSLGNENILNGALCANAKLKVSGCGTAFTDADAATAATMGTLWLTNMEKLVKKATAAGKTVVVGSVYSNQHFQQHHTAVTYDVNQRLKAAAPTWGDVTVVDFLPWVTQCSDPSNAKCGHWPTSESGTDYEFNYNHPNALGFAAMWGRAVDSTVLDAVNQGMGSLGVGQKSYQEHAGACTGSSATTSFEGDMDLGKLHFAQNEAACRYLCNADPSCNSYDFSTDRKSVV